MSRRMNFRNEQNSKAILNLNQYIQVVPSSKFYSKFSNVLAYLTNSVFHTWLSQTVYTLKCYFESNHAHCCMSHKQKTSYNTKSFICSCLEHRRCQIGMRKLLYCLILHANSNGIWAIVFYSTDKKYEFSIVLSGQPDPLIFSGPGVNLTPLIPSRRYWWLSLVAYEFFCEW